MVKNTYIGKSLTELNAEKQKTQIELKRLGEKYTLMPLGSTERDDMGSQIYDMYYELSQLEQAIKATTYAD